jgi:hypothetical protein
MRTYTVMIMLLCAVVIGGGALSADPDRLALNTVIMKIDGKQYRFTGTTAGSLTDLGNGTVRITIGLRDRGQGVMMRISADLPEDRKGEELHLAADYADISMVYKSAALQFMIAPALQMARDSDVQYYENTGRAVRSRIKKHRPDWFAMDREERIASGKGIVREKSMEGTSLFLVIRPVADSGRQELRGTFSGVARVPGGKKGTRPVVINGGQFRVEVIEQ